MKKYTIKEGKHYSLHGQWLHVNKKELIIKAKIPYTSKYDLKDEDQLDVNKVGGIGFGFNHHDNSIRLGWNNNIYNKIEWYLYLYNHGYRDIIPLCEGRYDDEFILKLDIDRNTDNIKYFGYNLDHTVRGSTGFNFLKVPKFGFYCYPYFGGNEVAPCEIVNYLEIK